MPGYKHTEIGVIPEDWGIAPINSLAFITTGAKNTQDRVEGGQYPFFVRSQTVERINSYSFDGEAVLTAGDGVGTGKVFHYVNGKLDFHQRVYKISDFKKNLNGYFFYLYFSNYFYDRIMSMTAKSSVDSVRMEMIADMTIPLPPIAEQLAIAAALSDVDALIRELDELIAKKRAIKQGTMQQLLTGKTRLPGFSGEWRTKKLAQVAQINMGQSPDSKHYNQNGNGIPLIQGNADIDNRKSIKRVWTTQAPKVCNAGDLLLTVRAPVGSVGIATEYSCVGRGVCSLKPVNHNASFLFHALVFAENHWKTIEQGSTFTSANSTQIAEFPLLTTESFEEQTAIAAVLSDMDAEITALEQQRDKTRALKQGMMQELLTGKTRLV